MDAETYSETCQTSKMTLLAKIVNSLKLLKAVEKQLKALSIKKRREFVLGKKKRNLLGGKKWKLRIFPT